jgi:hypothetical protein
MCVAEEMFFLFFTIDASSCSIQWGSKFNTNGDDTVGFTSVKTRISDYSETIS